MICGDVRSQLTAYLEGELSDHRGGAVRGHLRTCAGCRALAEDEASLRDGLRALPPRDPPATLWAGVQARLAAAEVAEASRPAWRRALSRIRVHASSLALGSAVAAAAATLLVAHARQDEGPGWTTTASPGPSLTARPRAQARPDVEGSPSGPTGGDPRDVSVVLASAPAQVTAAYAAASAELLELARQERGRWPVQVVRAFDLHVAALQAQIAQAESARDRQRGHRALIRYLQRAMLRDDVTVASAEPGARP